MRRFFKIFLKIFLREEKECPKCHTVYIGNYCWSCGEKMIALPTCEYCKEELKPRMLVCPNCGQKIPKTISKNLIKNTR